MALFDLATVASNMNRVSVGPADLYFSYSTLIAARVDGKQMRSPDTYSKTTAGHMTKMGVKDWPIIGKDRREFEMLVEMAILSANTRAAFAIAPRQGD